jgi:hypothetical protein
MKVRNKTTHMLTARHSQRLLFALLMAGSLIAARSLRAEDEQSLAASVEAASAITIVEVGSLYDGGSIWLCIKDDRTAAWGLRIWHPAKSSTNWVFITNTNIHTQVKVPEGSALENKLIALLSDYSATNKPEYRDIIPETISILKDRLHDRRRLLQAYLDYHAKHRGARVPDTNNPFHSYSGPPTTNGTVIVL